MPQVSQSIDDRRYYPMLFISANGGDIVPATIQVWAKYRTLPQEKKDILMSDELPEKIKVLQNTFRVSDEAIGQVTLCIREIFFGALQMAECEARIGAMLTTTNGGDPNQAKAITTFIQKEILTIQPKPRVEEREEEERPRGAVVNLPLLQAMSKYEQLGNQLITQERIRIKSQADPVRPSLVYWIKYYRDELGVGVHDSVTRGNFLFRSENGKKLSVEERERVNLILKSVEENYPLPIDTEKMEIVFPSFATSTPNRPETKKEPFVISSGAKIIKGPAFGAKQEGGAAMNSAGAAKGAPRQFAGLGETNKKVLNPHQSGSLIINQDTRAAGIAAEGGELRFSSSHVFPAEKERRIEKREGAAVQPVSADPVVPQATPEQPVATPIQMHAVRPNPFRIRPVSSRSEETNFKP